MLINIVSRNIHQYRCLHVEHTHFERLNKDANFHHSVWSWKLGTLNFKIFYSVRNNNLLWRLQLWSKLKVAIRCFDCLAKITLYCNPLTVKITCSFGQICIANVSSKICIDVICRICGGPQPFLHTPFYMHTCVRQIRQVTLCSRAT